MKGMIKLKDYIEVRCKEVAQFIIDTGKTYRETAKAFGVSKATIQKDLQERLPVVNPMLFSSAHKVVKKNEAEKHIRGGQATKLKYAAN